MASTANNLPAEVCWCTMGCRDCDKCPYCKIRIRRDIFTHHAKEVHGVHGLKPANPLVRIYLEATGRLSSREHLDLSTEEQAKDTAAAQ